ncbi:MAG TPA: glycoside hydrolase family 44 protein [Thermoanaerobaculia bacterium]|nr:glycoside hydrolase family 44 protein [Thermoanaerobaculia bacterium]
MRSLSFPCRCLSVLTLSLPALLGAHPAAAAPLMAYDDQLRNGFSDWSWATRSMAQTAVVRTGTAAISFEPDGWAGLFFHRDLGIDTGAYEAVELWVHGSAPGGQNVRIALTSGGDPVGNDAPLAGFVTGGAIPAGQWARALVPFASLGVTSGSFDGFWLQDGTGGDQPAIYVDDVQLIERSTPPPPPAAITVSMDLDADRRPISPLIYGVNFGSDAQAADLQWPVRRWGGNAVTRYSWQHDISNKASDWFYYNIESDTPNPATLPHGSTADLFIDATRNTGGEPIITVPLIGWTPIDRTRRWGFSVGKYGAQQKTECTETGNVFWCNPDAGNGVYPNGTPITANDPHDTSREIGTGFVTDWMAHIASRTGAAGDGGVRFFALDNEPMLWNSTHRDVHPAPVTYDEMWQRTRDYAAAMKAEDPAIQILGPSDWGWCAYFFSAADGCSAGPDAAAHGNVPFLPWYLQQVRAYELAHGVRLVDYLDIHYYPQGTNIALSSDESATTAARRLRSLKGLYDPSYIDESWIGQPVRLIPRMKEWVASYLPGAKLAITEYNWGNDGGVTSALAQAEALAIFGREGVDLATRWVAPAADTPVEDAFRLYLDYDGAGGKVEGDSVRAVSSNVDAVGAYAVRGAGTRVYLLLFNKDTASHQTDIRVAGGLSGAVTLYRFGAAGRLAAAGTATLAGGALGLVLPSRSATLAVVELTEPPAGAGFYTLAPCRVLDTRQAAGAFGGPVLSAGAGRQFPFAGRCGIPAGARAVSVNVTVVSPTQGGFVRAYPGGVTAPSTSLINFSAGQIRANNAILPLAADGNGTLVFQAGFTLPGTVHLLVDVNGYFQ